MRPTLPAPFPWFGGKSRIAPEVWLRFGNVANYVEPFMGSGATLLARPTAPNLETVNDVDAYLVNFWRAVRAQPAAVAELADYPVSEIDLEARHLWLVQTGAERVERLRTDPEYFDVCVAAWWVWGLSQWIGSGWCSARRDSRTTGHLARDGAPPRKRPALGRGGRGVQRRRPSLTGCRGIEAGEMPIAEWCQQLAARLRRVRMLCGDWTRVLTPNVTWKIGGGMQTAVFLDPPYALGERDPRLYAHDEADIAVAVREWAIANGGNPRLRIALCGYQDEHDMPRGWECLSWKSPGGYGSIGANRARANALRERVWFSPHCLKPQPGLFD